MWIEKHNILRHGVFNKEILKVPKSKVGYLGRLALGNNQDVTRFKVSVNNWTPHIVKVTQTLQVIKQIHG